MKTVKGTIVRGYITRYNREEEWEDVLVMLPDGTVACDADAIPHYKLYDDGKFREYYGWEASTKEDPTFLPKEFV